MWEDQGLTKGIARESPSAHPSTWWSLFNFHELHAAGSGLDVTVKMGGCTAVTRHASHRDMQARGERVMAITLHSQSRSFSAAKESECPGMWAVQVQILLVTRPVLPLLMRNVNSCMPPVPRGKQTLLFDCLTLRNLSSYTHFPLLWNQGTGAIIPSTSQLAQKYTNPEPTFPPSFLPKNS